MRLLVFSDTHGNSARIRTIVKRHSDIEHIAFLGDVLPDLTHVTELAGKTVYKVRGNCDPGSNEPEQLLIELEGRKVFMCHGDTFNVKWGVDRLLNFAMMNNVELAMFGHTHQAVNKYYDGVYIVNPGSLGRPYSGRPTYAIIDISEQGILPNIIEY